MILRFSLQFAVLLLLSACAGPAPRWLPQSDGAPNVTLDPSQIADAVPRHEPIRKAGNKSPYRVNGRTYHVLANAEGYRDEGIASWYGTKFHGRLTSNGEPYDALAMTAAHRELPIPCYVRVTNLDNGRTAIVRVNDRGPFHDQRIIDLSYAAAVKLGFAQRGTAAVSVEVVTPESAPDFNQRYFLQAGAFKSLVSAQNLKQQLLAMTDHQVNIHANQQQGGYYRVRIGPIYAMDEANQLRVEIEQRQLGRPQLLEE